MRKAAAPGLALGVVLLAAAGTVRAQAQEPVGPFVVDVRGLTGGLPTGQGWTPAVPPGGVVPARGFGGEAGGHVYAGRLGPARLGFGATLGLVRGTAAPDPGVAAAPRVVTRATALAPQVSFNFGHRLGWSYLSGGVGGLRLTSRSAASATLPPAAVTSGWVRAVNVGGGARWFVTDRLGVGFDLRWHRLAAPATSSAARRTTLVHFAVGLSIQ